MVKDKATPKLRDEVIDRLYDVAVDPTQYEALLDQWESMIKPLRKNATGALSFTKLEAEYSSHFNRADKVLEKLGAPEQADATIANQTKAAAFLIGPDLRVADANDAARTVLSVNNGDKLSELQIDADDIKLLEKQTASMLMANSDKTDIFRSRLRQNQRLVVFHLQTLRQDDQPPMVVAIASELVWPTGFADLLKNAFELTDAEVSVIKGLSDGLNVKQISSAKNRSLGTIRTQLKSSLAKTETHSQSELLRLTLSMMDIANYTEDKAADISGESIGINALIAQPFHVLALRDGRKMDYLILGDPVGKPCLFYPQDYGFTRWPASAEAYAKKRGIKIIIQIRPGYANSTPLPKKHPLGEVIADDTAELMAHLEIEKCPVITMGSDIFHALHYHYKYREKISVIISASGTMPFETSAQYERMDKWYRFILASARYTPHLLPFMVKAGFLLARRLGKRKFVHAVFGQSGADIKTFENPEVYEAMICGSEVCLSDSHSAHNAFAAEVLAQERNDWSYLIKAAEHSVPVYYFNGMQDPQVPVETLREFQQKYPWIKYQEYKDAGQLVFFLKWREIIPFIEKFL